LAFKFCRKDQAHLAVGPPGRRAPRGAFEIPMRLSEPGVFIVRPDSTLYYGSAQTMPFARPSFQDLLGAIDFAIVKGYPARGEYTGEV